MTDPSRAHAAAIKDLVELTEYPTYLGKVTDPDEDLTYPHLIVWPPPARRTLVNLNGSGATLTTVTQVTAVGRDPDEVLAALDRVAAQLVGVKPSIPGRCCTRIDDLSPGQPPDKNESLHTPDGQSTYRGIGLYQLMSTPA